MNIRRFVASIIVGTSLCLVGFSPAWALDLTECAELVPNDAAAGDPAYDVLVTEGIVYGLGERETGTQPLLLDLYEPTQPTVSDHRRSPILVIHGGAFLRGSRQFLPWVCMAAELAMRGFVVASIDYRTHIDGDNPVLSERVLALPVNSQLELLMVAAVEDGLTAVDWLFDNSDVLHLDPTRLGVMGSSAGAITAIHLAYTVTDFGIDVPALGFVVDFFGGAFIPYFDPDTGALFDPVVAANHLETGEPPLFIVHGIEDQTVPISFSDLLVNRAGEQGVPYEFHAIPGAGHGFDFINPHVDKVESGLTIFDRMVAWIQMVESDFPAKRKVPVAITILLGEDGE